MADGRLARAQIGPGNLDDHVRVGFADRAQRVPAFMRRRHFLDRSVLREGFEQRGGRKSVRIEHAAQLDIADSDDARLHPEIARDRLAPVAENLRKPAADVAKTDESESILTHNSLQAENK